MVKVFKIRGVDGLYFDMVGGKTGWNKEGRVWLSCEELTAFILALQIKYSNDPESNPLTSRCSIEIFELSPVAKVPISDIKTIASLDS